MRLLPFLLSARGCAAMLSDCFLYHLCARQLSVLALNWDALDCLCTKELRVYREDHWRSHT